MNLSINGSVPKMQAASAQRALAVNPRIKNVLWDIHFFYLLDAEGGEAFPYYLYNGSFLDDADYFFNITNLKSSVAFLLGKFDGFLLGVDENGSWYQSLFAAGRFDVYKSIEMRKKMLADIEAAPLLSPLDQQAISALQYPDVEKYLLDVILPLCNSDKQINIMFSPVTRYYYASQGDDRHVYRQIYLRRYIMEKTLACTNMKVFAFDDADWIVADLTNYADNFHYQIGVNDYVLQSIAEDRHHLSPANIDQYERDFIAAINAYRQQFVAELAAMENAPADPAPPSPLQ